jgi:hypothetical protein
MMKILFLILTSAFTAFAQDSNRKTIIDISQVSYIEIVKVKFSGSTTSQTKKLSKKQCLDFAQKWNVSKELGADKYRMKYFVDVFLKNGEKRQFSIRDAKIQEYSWTTFDIGGKLYFDKLWNEIK